MYTRIITVTLFFPTLLLKSHSPGGNSYVNLKITCWSGLSRSNGFTLIRSIRREDLNIQSSFISSFLSRSSRLPREQYSVTMAKMPQSEKKPRNRFTFSWRKSFIWNKTVNHRRPSQPDICSASSDALTIPVFPNNLSHKNGEENIIFAAYIHLSYTFF